jgi:hypothetical protein
MASPALPVPLVSGIDYDVALAALLVDVAAPGLSGIGLQIGSLLVIGRHQALYWSGPREELEADPFLACVVVSAFALFGQYNAAVCLVPLAYVSKAVRSPAPRPR